MPLPRCFVYILENTDDPRRYYYTGLTSDLAVRLRQHNEGQGRYTADGRPRRVDVRPAKVKEQSAFSGS